MSFLVYTNALNDEPTFILACDDATLNWLSASFRELGRIPDFSIGDGQPIDSDQQCVLDVQAGAPGSDVSIVPTAEGRFRWTMSPEQARQYAALIDGMIEEPGAGHQYLESAIPNVPVVLVSRDEYDLVTLREMREAAKLPR